MRPCPDHDDPVYETINNYLILECLQCDYIVAGARGGICNIRSLIKSAKEHVDAFHPPWEADEMIDQITQAVSLFNRGRGSVEFDIFRIQDW